MSGLLQVPFVKALRLTVWLWFGIIGYRSLYSQLCISEKEGDFDVQDILLYRIGELSKLAGVSPRTIDFYTSMGLIEPEMRSAKNYRLYSDETLLRLKRIVQMKKDKYSLDEIKSNITVWRKVSSEEAGITQTFGAPASSGAASARSTRA